VSGGCYAELVRPLAEASQNMPPHNLWTKLHRLPTIRTTRYTSVQDFGSWAKVIRAKVPVGRGEVEYLEVFIIRLGKI